MEIYISYVYSLIMGAIIAGVYVFIHRKSNIGFIFTLLLLPLIISTIIIIMGDNVAGAFSLAGIFSIVRFRSTPGKVEEITYILYTVAVGLFSAVALYLAGIAFLIIVCLITIVFYSRNRRKTMAVLQILIPEDLNFINLFDDTLTEYCSQYELEHMITKDLGSLYELKYNIVIKDDNKIKEMIDAVRVKNGNLTVQLTARSDQD